MHYVRMVNGEPTGQPAIKDILIDDAQVRCHFLDKWSLFSSLSCKSLVFDLVTILSLIAHQLLHLDLICCLFFSPFTDLISGNMMIQLNM